MPIQPECRAVHSALYHALPGNRVSSTMADQAQGREAAEGAARSMQSSERSLDSSDGHAPLQMSVTSDEVNYLIFR